MSRPLPHWTILLFLTGGACSPLLDALHPENPANGNSSQGTITPKAITFEDIQTKILQPFCFSCHSTTAGNEGGVNLETYANVKLRLIDMQKAVNTNVMPKDSPPLSDELKKLLNDWIAAGAPQDFMETSEEVLSRTVKPPED